MKYIFLTVAILCLPVKICAEILGNPAVQVGVNNLVVGVEYTILNKIYDVDTKKLETSSERALVKVTTGLTDRMDVYLKAGGVKKKMDYSLNFFETSNLGYAVSDYNSEYAPGIGGGLRLRLYNNVDSGIRVFAQGGGFAFRTSGTIHWEIDDSNSLTKEREMTWIDLHGGLGVVKRINYMDFYFGGGYSIADWEIRETDVWVSPSGETSIRRVPIKSTEFVNPFFGFFGIDFILPHEYRISAQASIRNGDEMEFTIALSQGLER